VGSNPIFRTILTNSSENFNKIECNIHTTRLIYENKGKRVVFLFSYVTCTENVCSQVKIIKSIKGNLKPGEVIPVMQSGVSTGEKNQTIPSSKLHKVNQRCVFFLRYCTPDTEQLKKDYKIPLYVELNPFQGHINITDDNLNFDSYELPMFKDIDNIDDLEKIINNDMKTLNNKQ
jgi:hypothetical protein